MRQRNIILVAIGTILALSVWYVWTLASLLWHDGADQAILRSELALDVTLPIRIPKVLHQVWKNQDIPDKWQEPYQQCQDLNNQTNGWQYMLWTDEKARDFIAQQYPWFLDTFDGYKYDIMRADAIRYFVLYHHGGVYVDLDIGCLRNLDPLLVFPAVLLPTKPTGVSNNVMAAEKGHPFFFDVIHSLQRYDMNWLFPYITVMASTGPLVFSLMWRRWDAQGHNLATSPDSQLRLLLPEEYADQPWSFFQRYVGSSWHRGDAQAVLWVSRVVCLAHSTVH